MTELLLMNIRKKNLLNGGIKYLNIPYKVDHCEKDSSGKYKCDNNPTISVRKERLKSYIDSKIRDIL